MPVAEKITGGEVYLRGIDERVAAGDRVEVSEEMATYLTEDRGDFRLVDTVPVDDLIDQGVCPWCDDYEGDAVGQHASSAHSDAWTDYKED